MTPTRQDQPPAGLLELPPVVRLPVTPDGWPVHRSSGLYGGAVVAAAYCGLAAPPEHLRGYWQHGWNPSYRQPSPPELILASRAPKEGHYWVARADEEECLRSHGFANVAAIGLPVVYLPPREVKRVPGSLLVMPAHSLDYTKHSWKFDEYAEVIAGLRREFAEVVVCIYPSCWKHGYWVDAFRARGLPLIVGARYDDRNAYERMRYLMSRFEYVTTNGFGSHLIYAAYWGAKPSLYGPYAGLREEDFKNDPLFRGHPELLGEMLRWLEEGEVRRQSPALSCHPAEAKTDVEWGRFEMGEQHKVTPGRMRRLFEWTAWGRVKQSIPGRVRHWGRLLVEPAYRAEQREKRRLWELPPGEPATTKLYGRDFELLDGGDFLAEKARVVDQQAYAFVAGRAAPRVIDCGANVGVAVAFFKNLHPGGEVVAFEPVPRLYEALRRNCAGYAGVRLVNQAVWPREGRLRMVAETEARWRVADAARPEEQAVEVGSCRLRDYLTDKVDLLKLNIGGAELDVLLDCEDLLGQVDHLAVDYHSFAGRPQRLDELMGLLARAGYRVHVQAPAAGPSPLLFRPLRRRKDAQLHLFAFRE